MKRPATGKSSRKVLVRKSKSNTSHGQHELRQLKDSVSRGELVVVIGTGVSIALTNGKIPALSWKGLIQDGFAYGAKKGKISEIQAEAWKAQLESSDLDDLLSAAEFMGRKLDAPGGDLYARWLEKVFKNVQPTNASMVTAVKSLHDANIPICTVNFDLLLENVTKLETINLTEITKVTAWMRRERLGILHLHGAWDAPPTCAVGIRDYALTLGDDVRNLIQRSLGAFRRLLFIGCGDTFADPNFSALVHWLRKEMKTAAPEHYALVSGSEVKDRHVDHTWQGFVEPLVYGPSHADLPAFLVKHFRLPPKATSKVSSASARTPANSSKQSVVLRDYRAFLLKDCGQMTIEGVRADMDTAQRRFDLERLFVPLDVQPNPPEIPENDPQRQQKLTEWQAKEGSPRSFGQVFSENKRMVLLALPGGGKTLLLKRLAVAYASDDRRTASKDELPRLDLIPVLIRCREWREHIRRPILTLLGRLSDITGLASLGNFSNAILPYLNSGRVLLLVDGLDEIHDDADRSTFVDHLEQFLDEYSLIRLVITSREAGFNLVAPSLARFCKRLRVAPLNEDAINALCDHWQSLMAGDTPEMKTEGRELAKNLLQSESLRRLAENPLLLTMLLVVKHGAGRLPPDRVSLYGRAMEVLLDTWNIKGHDPLNPKEAVPQLAYVAFQLMRAGKQTATESELLTVLEEARERVPQIRRYAKDTPQEFLKRVELRSSLLVEAGHQLQNGHVVPFYQFRHLTFQEYLAAVAAVEGHYMEYDKSDTVLTPLAAFLTSEEWKEVIPMAAVLARKQAEMLMVALVTDGNNARIKAETGQDFAGRKEWESHSTKMPPSVARLVQCLVEEAEATSETLTSALQLAVFFAKGCDAAYDWQALSRGPYGSELRRQAWLIYSPMRWPEKTWMLNTCGSLFARQESEEFWKSNAGQAKIHSLLNSDQFESIAQGLLICMGRQWNSLRPGSPAPDLSNQWSHIERYILNDAPTIWPLAVWIWNFVEARRPLPLRTKPELLDRLLRLWLSEHAHRVSFALTTLLGLPRTSWNPVLSNEEVEQMRIQPAKTDDPFDDAANLVVAFHSGKVWSDEELAERLGKLFHSSAVIGDEAKVRHMLTELGEIGKKYLKSLKPRRRKNRKVAN